MQNNSDRLMPVFAGLSEHIIIKESWTAHF